MHHLYKNRKVFVTGHTGFKGSWLCLWLTSIGAIVKGYSLEPLPDSLYNEIADSLSIESVFSDIRNAKQLEKELVCFKPDIIFHLAAQPLVRASYQNPIDTFDINVSGTSNLLAALQKLDKPCRVIVITTDKVYENKEWYYPYREVDRLGGHDPYSASKACAELVCTSYKRSFFSSGSQIQLITARAGNVIGGGDMAKDRIIPDIIRALKMNLPVELRNPRAIRPWQHVLEPLQGYLELGITNYYTTEAEWDSFNFGPNVDDVLSVKELAEIAINIWGEGNFTHNKQNEQPHEAGILTLDISKTLSLLNWRPLMTSREAISITLDWYKKNQEKVSGVKELMLEQIKTYTQKI